MCSVSLLLDHADSLCQPRQHGDGLPDTPIELYIKGEVVRDCGAQVYIHKLVNHFKLIVRW